MFSDCVKALSNKTMLLSLASASALRFDGILLLKSQLSDSYIYCMNGLLGEMLLDGLPGG
jgi:hypothetical protein